MPENVLFSHEIHSLIHSFVRTYKCKQRTYIHTFIQYVVNHETSITVNWN